MSMPLIIVEVHWIPEFHVGGVGVHEKEMEGGRSPRQGPHSGPVCCSDSRNEGRGREGEGEGNGEGKNCTLPPSLPSAEVVQEPAGKRICSGIGIGSVTYVANYGLPTRVTKNT